MRINGALNTNIKGIILNHNDRICIGPAAFFLFKNKRLEADQSMADDDEDPISYDFAADEVSRIENEAQRKDQDEMKKFME